MQPDIQASLGRRAEISRSAPSRDSGETTSLNGVPPFDEETALVKARSIEDAWNIRDVDRVVAVCTEDCLWQCRGQTHLGRDAIGRFLCRSWAREHACRTVVEAWSWTGARMALRMTHEWHDYTGNWFRSHATELWDFAADGQVSRRMACIDDMLVTHDGRLFLWPQGPRPRDHPGLSELGL